MQAPIAMYYAQNIAFMLALCFMPEYVYIMAKLCYHDRLRPTNWT